MYIIKIATIYTISDIKFLFEHVQELLSLRTLYRHSIDVKKSSYRTLNCFLRETKISIDNYFFSQQAQKNIFSYSL